MLCLRRNDGPVDYSKCNQTVTVYHQNTPGDYVKTVYNNAFFDFKKTQNIDKTGSREANSFLLVIPCSAPVVSVGDKILHGEGSDIKTRDDWAAFIPAKVPGLVIVGYVDPKYWGGKMIHLEAGG